MDKEIIKVSLASESDRYKTVFKSLDQVFDDISQKLYQLKEDDYVLIKPNCINCNKPNASTNIDAIRAVLDFITPIWQGRIVIAEGSGKGNTLEAFKNYGYLDLKSNYSKLEFLDVNYSDSIFANGFDSAMQPLQLRISNTIAEAPFRISISPPKTHDDVIVTLSIKNMAIGSLLKEDKSVIHHGPKAINRTIAEISKFTFPHLAVIDGWVGMQGNGPVDGDLIETHFAIASTNALAADCLTAELMGFNPVQIGYLNLLGAVDIKDQIGLVGRDPKEFQFHFKHPPTYLKQIQWS